MRHNLVSRGAASATVLVIALLFSGYAPLQAEKEKPARQDQKQEKPAAEEQAREPDSHRTSDTPAGTRQAGPSMEDIDRAWMESIQGSRSQPGNTFSNPGESAAENSEGKPEETSAEPAAQSPGPSSRMFVQQEGPSFFSLFFRFVLFMGLMGAGFYGLVRFMKKKSGIVSSGDGGPLRVVASISLMPGKYMQVVDMAGQLMVLGVSDQGVRLLQTVEDGSVADRIRLWEENRPEPAENFLQGLQGLLKTTDLRLWKSKNQRESKPDFQAILSGRSSSDDVPMEDLEALLQQQNRRLRAVTSKPGPRETS
ncbi:MAG: flagellar biosynthetic protein FliO [Leptospiraceae bacterium]|nr:flagellar biosynthetic protein FliO [Leptospiraceae bacterium]